LARRGEVQILIDADLFDRAASLTRHLVGVPRWWGRMAQSQGRRVQNTTTASRREHTVVALNHQQFDLRSANLELRLGAASRSGAGYASVQSRKVPARVGGGRAFTC
jgi:hypothetical protein